MTIPHDLSSLSPTNSFPVSVCNYLPRYDHHRKIDKRLEFKVVDRPLAKIRLFHGEQTTVIKTQRGEWNDSLMYYLPLVLSVGSTQRSRWTSPSVSRCESIHRRRGESRNGGCIVTPVSSSIPTKSWLRTVQKSRLEETTPTRSLFGRDAGPPSLGDFHDNEIPERLEWNLDEISLVTFTAGLEWQWWNEVIRHFTVVTGSRRKGRRSHRWESRRSCADSVSGDTGWLESRGGPGGKFYVKKERENLLCSFLIRGSPFEEIESEVWSTTRYVSCILLIVVFRNVSVHEHRWR